MRARFLHSMQDALNLVRSGQLQQATQLIQQNLRRDVRRPQPKSEPTEAEVIEAQVLRKTSAKPEAPVVEKEEVRASAATQQGRREPQFLNRSFSNEYGSRDYKLYIPSSYIDEPLPLVIMLHGCTQDAEDFALGTAMNQLAEEFGVLVAYPNQNKTANSKRCWNWYKPQNQQTNRGEPAIIAGITQAVMRNYHVDPKRVYVTGLSAGGAMASIMGATYPDLYAAVGVHSGIAAGSASNVISALAVMRKGSLNLKEDKSGLRSFVPTIVFHGDRDVIVNLRNAEQVFAQAKQRLEASNDAYFNTEQSTVNPNKGHAYTCTKMQDGAGNTQLEYWLVHGAGHAWSGGEQRGSYVDPAGPNASREMLRFFLEHPQQ